MRSVVEGGVTVEALRFVMPRLNDETHAKDLTVTVGRWAHSTSALDAVPLGS